MISLGVQKNPMFLRLLQLQWKSYRRSAAFTSGVITSVFYLFGMLYFIGMFTLLGYGSFYVLDEEMGLFPFIPSLCNVVALAKVSHTWSLASWAMRCSWDMIFDYFEMCKRSSTFALIFGWGRRIGIGMHSEWLLMSTYQVENSLLKIFFLTYCLSCNIFTEWH